MGEKMMMMRGDVPSSSFQPKASLAAYRTSTREQGIGPTHQHVITLLTDGADKGAGPTNRRRLLVGVLILVVVDTIRPGRWSSSVTPPRNKALRRRAEIAELGTFCRHGNC